MKETTIKIRGYHCDSYGHVNNSRYLELLEEARWDFLDQENRIEHFKNLGLQFFIVNININYRKALILGDEIKINVSLLEHGNTSITLKQEITRNNELAADALIKFVLFDSNTGKPTRVTEAHVAKFK